MPGAAHAAFVRSPYAHARIHSIDASAALEAPGVIAVLTAADYVADGHKAIAHVPNPADAVEWSVEGATHRSAHKADAQTSFRTP